MAFLREQESGSPELRDRVINDAVVRLSQRPLPNLVDPLRVQRPLAVAAAFLCLTLLATLLKPAWVATAAARLALPTAAVRWPRIVALELLTERGEPLGPHVQIGRGQTLRFLIRNRHGDVPADLRLEVVSPVGPRRTEPVPTLDSPSSVPTGGTVEYPGRVGAATLFAAEGPLQFRAVGGDDLDMPMLTADVIIPPQLDSMSIVVTPPAYLRQAPARLPDGAGTVRGVVGSVVSVTATATKPLSAAELRVRDDGGPEPELSADGRTLTVRFVLKEPGVSSFWFRLQDLQGFQNSEAPRHELQVVADTVPSVTLTRPEGDLRVTATATVAVELDAKDDFGLTGVRMRFGRGSVRVEDSPGVAEETVTIPLFSLDESTELPRSGTYRYDWQLAPLALTVGDRLTFRAEATDAYDLEPQHLGTSEVRTLTVVTPEQKRDELLDQQSHLLADLARAAGEEERLREAVRTLREQIRGVGRLRPQDRDLLARAELEQRRLAATLTEPLSSVAATAEQLRRQFELNHLDEPRLATQLARLAGELSALAADPLPAADRDLTAARKFAEPDPAAAGRALDSAATHLDLTVNSLHSLLEELKAWQNRHDLAGDIADLLTGQQELADETTRVAASTLGKPANRLSDQQQTDLDRIGRRQTALAQQLARLTDSVRNAAAEPPTAEATKPQLAAIDPTLSDTADALAQAGLAASARAAAAAMARNDLGEAGRLQRDVLETLRQTQESLSRKPQGDAAAAETLKKAAGQLDDLVRDNDSLRDTLQKQAVQPQGLSQDQQQAASDEVGRNRASAAALARSLDRGGAPTAAAALRRAGAQMTDALERLRRNDAAAAQERLTRAAAELEDARADVEQEQQSAAARLAEKLRETAAASAAALALRQQAANEEIGRLAMLQQAGRLTRAQLISLRDLATLQTTLADEAQRSAETLQSAGGIAVALQSASRRMTAAAQLLQTRNVGEETQQNGAVAKRMLDQVAAVLKPPAPSDSTPPEAASNPAEPPQHGPPGEAIALLAQCELLKMMQEDLLQRTQMLNAAVTEDTEAGSREQQHLAEEQAAILAAVEQLVAAAAAQQNQTDAASDTGNERPE